MGVVDKINSHETSLHSLATGELDCPRLFVLLPLETSGSQLSMLLKPKAPSCRDRTRDASSGCAHALALTIRHLC